MNSMTCSISDTFSNNNNNSNNNINSSNNNNDDDVFSKENRTYPHIKSWLFIPLNEIKSQNIFEFIHI